MVSGAAEVQFKKHRSEGHSGGAQDKNQIPSFLSAIGFWQFSVAA
jgi:hypothetical protein